MKKLVVLIILIAVLTVIGRIWWTNGLKEVNKNDPTPVIFVIKKGAGMREIANSLKRENLIHDPIVFFLYVRSNGTDKKIQAGDFKLNRTMSAQQIADSLTHGTLDIWVTIPEGKRASEISEIFKNNLPSYAPTWDETLSANEGYLFPDTYLIPRDADINFVLSMLKNNFDKKYNSIQQSKNSAYSQQQIVTIASLVEREAKFPQDRPLVASVILNRLDIGMKLDIDATVQYGLGYQPGERTWWKKNLTEDDLTINSAYNTYENAGLPPTPIANPGLAALSAVVNPADTQYLFYISDKSGRNHYARTISEHNANIKKYGL